MTDTTRPNLDEPQYDESQYHASPMLWLLLLAAVVAFAWWYFANRADTTQVVAPDLAIIEGTAQDAEAERDTAAQAQAASGRSSAPGKAVATTAPRASEPQLLSAKLPRYPADERRRGVQGDVTLRIGVNANGFPTDVDYASRSGNRALDRAAMTAAQNWRFQPAMRGGQPVASTVNVPVAFRL